MPDQRNLYGIDEFSMSSQFQDKKPVNVNAAAASAKSVAKNVANRAIGDEAFAMSTSFSKPNEALPPTGAQTARATKTPHEPPKQPITKAAEPLAAPRVQAKPVEPKLPSRVPKPPAPQKHDSTMMYVYIVLFIVICYIITVILCNLQ